MAIDENVVFFWPTLDVNEIKASLVGVPTADVTVNETFVAGLIDTALDSELDGRVNFPEMGTLIPTNEYTISFWLNPDTLTNSQQLFWFVDPDDTNTQIIYAQLESSGRIRYNALNGGVTQGSILTFPGNALTAGTWHHVMFVCGQGAGNMVAYIDGVQASATVSPTTTTAGTATHDLDVGGRYTGGSPDFGGRVEQFVIYNDLKVLADSVALYNGGSGVANDLVFAAPAATPNSNNNYTRVPAIPAALRGKPGEPQDPTMRYLFGDR